MIDPFTVGCRAARRSLVKNGENAVVFGCGTIGIAAAISLKYFGCNKVMICDLSDFRLNIAKGLGFEVCNMQKDNFEEKVSAVFGKSVGLGGKECPNADIFIDAAGAKSVLDTFIGCGKIGSRIVLVAVNNAKRQLDLLHLTYAQKAIIGSGGYMPEDVRDVLKIMKSRKWELDKIITDKFPVEKLSDAIIKAADYEKAFNVVIDFEE